MKISNRMLSCAAAVLCAAAPSFAQKADEARINDLARDAARQFEAARSAVDQTRSTVPITAPGPNLELTLDEATARALERNLDLAVERLNPMIQDANLERVYAAYRPTVTSQIGHLARVQPPTSQLNGGTIVQNDTSTYNAGLTQALPWSGGDVSVTFNNNKQVTSNLFANFNPTFNSNLSATITQPLLRDFWIDGTRLQLKVTAINREISDIQLRGTLATTVANVRNAYWELVFSVQAVEVAEGSLDLAAKLVQDNRARVEVGTMAPLDVVQSEAEAATRRQALAQADATMRTAELSLKRLIVNGTDDPLWRATITPIDRPEFRSEPIDVEAAVRRALQSRTDLEQARKTLASNDVTMKFLRNQTLPALDAIANYGAQGLGGTQFVRGGLGSSQVLDTIPGGYGNAWRTLTGRDYPTWNFQVNFSYPLGGSAADAVYTRSRVVRNQTAAQLKALELQVATDVTNAALQVESSLKRYEAANVARSLAETRLSAEQSRFEVGLSTNFFVVQAQRDLATAQNTELRALLDYRQAIVDYGRVQEAPATRGGNSITAVTGN
ncbi:MAG TPA: TolC family protein [Vicinamibacterales bacterium]|nr:TolC family protein [Vicinamibacterales bacterium]